MLDLNRGDYTAEALRVSLIGRRIRGVTSRLDAIGTLVRLDS